MPSFTMLVWQSQAAFPFPMIGWWNDAHIIVLS
jgi:hypothetical protein